MIATSRMFIASALARPAEPLAGRGRHATPPPPERQALRPDALVGAINQMLAAHPECEGLEMQAGVLQPGYPDADGCNWRPHGLRLRVAHGPSTRALAGVRQVVELARLRYDLTVPDDA
jgi:hypothetical protein